MEGPLPAMRRVGGEVVAEAFSECWHDQSPPPFWVQGMGEALGGLKAPSPRLLAFKCSHRSPFRSAYLPLRWLLLSILGTATTQHRTRQGYLRLQTCQPHLDCLVLHGRLRRQKR